MDGVIYVLMINDSVQGFAYGEETIERILEERDNSNLSIATVKGLMAQDIIKKYPELHMDEELAITQSEYVMLDASLSQLPIDIYCFIDKNVNLLDFIKDEEADIIKAGMNLIKNRASAILNCEIDDYEEDIWDIEACKKYII